MGSSPAHQPGRDTLRMGVTVASAPVLGVRFQACPVVLLRSYPRWGTYLTERSREADRCGTREPVAVATIRDIDPDPSQKRTS